MEGVTIPSDNRVTACISTQAGCQLNCVFCATARLGFKRHLTAGEIYDQVFLLNKQSLEKYNLPLTNIVFMGMGEPLLNYNNVVVAIKWLTSEKGMGLGMGRITISTAGIPGGISQLAKDYPKYDHCKERT